MSNKRGNRDDDESSCDLVLNIINGDSFLQSTFQVVSFLRNPNNKLPVTPQLLDGIDTRPKAVLNYVENFIRHISVTHFDKQLYFVPKLKGFYDDKIYNLTCDFKGIEYDDISYGNVNISVREQIFMNKSLCIQFKVYFKELEAFIIRFVDELKLYGKNVHFEFQFRNNIPTIIFILPDNNMVTK